MNKYSWATVLKVMRHEFQSFANIKDKYHYQEDIDKGSNPGASLNIHSLSTYDLTEFYDVLKDLNSQGIIETDGDGKWRFTEVQKIPQKTEEKKKEENKIFLVLDVDHHQRIHPKLCNITNNKISWSVFLISRSLPLDFKQEMKVDCLIYPPAKDLSSRDITIVILGRLRSIHKFDLSNKSHTLWLVSSNIKPPLVRLCFNSTIDDNQLKIWDPLVFEKWLDSNCKLNE